MKRIKVVIVVPSLDIGGAENMVCQLAKALNKKNIELNVVCLSKQQNTQLELELLKNGICVNYLNNKGKLSVRTVILMWNYLQKTKPDIVHTHLHAPLYVFPWIFTHKKLLLHTIHSTPKYEFSSRIIKLMKKLYMHKKAVPISISSKIKYETSNLYNLPYDSIELIYNPVNTKKFSHTKINDSGNIRFVHVARLHPIKNQKLLIEAFSIVRSKLENASLIIVGDGELKQELEDLVSDLRLDDAVTFTGNITNVENFLCKSDIFVLSSTNEGVPLSILEAMAAGLPVVSTKVGGIEDIVGNNGFLVENGNVNLLTNAMLKISEDKALRDNMSKESLRLVKKYDVAIIAQEYETLYYKYS